MQDARISLQLQRQFLTGAGLRPQEHIPVVHVDTLHCLTVYKKQKLRVLRVVPLVDLGAHMHPHPLAVKLLRHPVYSLEPVVAVLAVPVHIPAVKTLPWCQIFFRILRMYVVAFLVAPLINRKFLLHL